MGRRKITIDIDETRRLRESGVAVAEIAKRFGVSYDIVMKRCMENGVVYGKGKSPANKRANNDPSRKKDGYKPHSGKSHRKRAREFGVEYDSSITWQTLSAELGHLNCQICGEPCDPNDKSWNGYFGPLHPTVDCIVAMKNGGGYVRGNVQLAHAMCNSVKSDYNDESVIAEVVNTYAPNGGRYRKRNAPGTVEDACASDSGHHRYGRRVAQHGSARTAVPRDDTRNRRAGIGA